MSEHFDKNNRQTSRPKSSALDLFIEQDSTPSTGIKHHWPKFQDRTTGGSRDGQGAYFNEPANM